MPGIGIGISPMLRRYRNAYGAYTTAWYTQVLANGGSATPTELAALTVFETAVGSDMAEFDRIFVLGLSNNVAARTSFVNPTSTMITAVNSPTHSSNGYSFNGTTQYLNLNYNPNTNGVKYTLNSSYICIYNRTTPSNITSDGVYVGANQILFYYNAAFSPSINDTALGISSLSTAARLTGMLRTDSSTKYAVINGVTSSAITRASTGVPSGNIYIGCRNGAGTPELFGTTQKSFVAAGSKNINQATWNTSVQALGTTLGWAV